MKITLPHQVVQGSTDVVHQQVGQVSKSMLGLASIFLSSGALICAVACGYLLVHEYIIEKKFIAIEGIIVGVQSKIDSRKGDKLNLYRPVVRVAPPQSISEEITGDVWSRRAPSVGSRLPARYNPENPAEVRLDAFDERYRDSMVIGVLAILMLIGSFFAKGKGLGSRAHLGINGQTGKGSPGSVKRQVFEATITVSNRNDDK